jgi:hypothetical protein
MSVLHTNHVQTLKYEVTAAWCVYECLQRIGKLLRKILSKGFSFMEDAFVPRKSFAVRHFTTSFNNST